MVFEEQEIGLGELIDVFKKRWLLILLPSILAAGVCLVATHVYYSRMPVFYAAQALIKIGGGPSRPLERIDEVSAVMHAQALLGEIAAGVNAAGFPVTPEAVAGSLSYGNDAGLLKISAVAARPELAAAMVHEAVKVVAERHRAKYADALTERDELVKYVKETARPLAVSFSTIADLRLEPTVIVAPAAAGNTPLPQPRRSVVVPVFVFTAFFMTLIALYLHFTQKNKSAPGKR